MDAAKVPKFNLMTLGLSQEIKNIKFVSMGYAHVNSLILCEIMTIEYERTEYAFRIVAGDVFLPLGG